MEWHKTHKAKQIPMRFILWVRWQYCSSSQSFFEKYNFPHKEMSQGFTLTWSIFDKDNNKQKQLCDASPLVSGCAWIVVHLFYMLSHISEILYMDLIIVMCLTSSTIRCRPFAHYCLVGWGNGSLPMPHYGLAGAYNCFHFITLNIYETEITKDSILVLFCFFKSSKFLVNFLSSYPSTLRWF